MAGTGRLVLDAQLFPPEPTSPSRARRFVAEVLEHADPDVVETAQLLVSELVTNAVLYARTDVEVRVKLGAGRVEVRVSDWQPTKALIPRQVDSEASTGRGLQMVDVLATRYGVDPLPGGKTVWFELTAATVADDRLERRWGNDLHPVHTDDVHIVLLEAPTALFQSAQRHRDSLLRECRLHAFHHGDFYGLPTTAVLSAQTAHDLITEAAEGQLVRAAADEVDVFEIRLQLPLSCGPAVADLRQVLDMANERARTGHFLTRPALPEIREFRSWLLREVTDQLAGNSARPWSPHPHVIDHAKTTSARTTTEAWSLGLIANTESATIAANDDNVIVAANEAACALLGWPAADLVGQRLISIIPSELREKHVVGFTNFLLSGQSRIMGLPVQVPALHRSGELVPVTLLLRVAHGLQGRSLIVAEFKPDTPAST